jgi:hypothetical protein
MSICSKPVLPATRGGQRAPRPLPSIQKPMQASRQREHLREGDHERSPARAWSCIWRSSMFLTDIACRFPPRRRDATSIQRSRYGTQHGRAGLQRLPDDRHDVRGVLIRPDLDSSHGALAGLGELGLPRVTPCVLAAARARRVRVDIRERSFSASTAKRCRTNGSTSALARRLRRVTLRRSAFDNCSHCVCLAQEM